MLKRLLVLALLCAAFVLLLGLMVISQAESPAPRSVVVAQSVFLPVPAPGRGVASDDTRSIAPKPEMPQQGVSRFVENLAELCRPFYLQRYFAFHYSSEAG